jgi:hypothetical protein
MRSGRPKSASPCPAESAPPRIASNASGHNLSGAARIHRSGSPESPSPVRKITRALPTRSIVRPQPGAAQSRAAAASAPCPATSTNPRPRSRTSQATKNGAATPMAAFQASWWASSGRRAGSRRGRRRVGRIGRGSRGVRRRSCWRRSRSSVVRPARPASRESSVSTMEVWPTRLAQSSATPARSGATHPTSVSAAVRRPKKRPCRDAGTRSPIHTTQALFPTTPSTAEVATTATNTARAASGVRSKRRAAGRPNQHKRDSPMANRDNRRWPSRSVSTAAGRWNTCAATGNAHNIPTAPWRKPRCNAHAVSAAPPAQARNSSASMPSATEVRSERRSQPRDWGGSGSGVSIGTVAGA